MTAELAVEYIAVADLIPYAANSRTHSDEQIAQISSSIRAFGFTNPILISDENDIIAGHGRMLAAHRAGLESVPCIRLGHLTEVQRRAYVIADNRLALNAGWDTKMLELEVEALKEEEFDLELLGFDDKELDALLNPEVGPAEGLTDPDAVPEHVETRCKPGDLWALGGHRLLCGDSTDVLQVERLMCGEKADICFTSPPYNCGKSPEDQKAKYLNDADDRSQDEFADFLGSALSLSLTAADFAFFNLQQLASNKSALADWLHRFKGQHADTLIWDKVTSAPAFLDNILNSRFEFVFCFSETGTRRIGKSRFRGTIDNIFALNPRSEPKATKLHGAVFPVALAEKFITDFAEPTRGVYEPFTGSGSTLIACEKTGRRCFGMEIDPKYCDVILARWEAFTGKTAVIEPADG